MFLFPFEVGLILVQSLTFLPQIVHNVRAGNNPGFSTLYILGFLTIRRFILPMYEHSCPQNLFMTHPSITFIVLWTLLFILQVLIFRYRLHFYICNSGKVLVFSFLKGVLLVITNTTSNIRLISTM
jgi:hypothetical protein